MSAPDFLDDHERVYRMLRLNRPGLYEHVLQLETLANSHGMGSPIFQDAERRAMNAANAAPIYEAGRLAAVDMVAEIGAIRRDVAEERATEKPSGESAPAADESKSSRRIAAIVATASKLGFDPMNVAWSGKAAIYRACYADDWRLFTDSTFEAAWKAARKAGRVRVENSEIYRGQ